MGQRTSGRQFRSDSANLDLLRSVAVLAVFACHFWGIRTGISERGSVAWHLGQLGVQMFFVHTCLVLMWSAERLKVEGHRLFSAFYVRRFFRIYPLSVTCVLIVYCLAHRWGGVGPLCHPGPLTWTRLWTNLTLTQTLSTKVSATAASMIVPLWSLPVEVQMYIGLPALFLLLRNRPAGWVLGIWLLSVPLALIQPVLGTRGLVFLFAPCFLAGVVAWRLAQDTISPRLPGWLWPAAIVAVSAIWMVAPPRHTDYYRDAFGLCLGLSIPFFREIPWAAVKRGARLVAKYSYGIYLSHFTILLIVFRRLPHHGRLARYSVLAVLSVAVPLALYHAIEAPGILYGKRIAAWMRKTRAPEIEAAPSLADEPPASLFSPEQFS
jgi:peptidoglycan/LPS O-acetylase OafA/YrhL